MSTQYIDISGLLKEQGWPVTTPSNASSEHPIKEKNLSPFAPVRDGDEVIVKPSEEASDGLRVMVKVIKSQSRRIRGQVVSITGGDENQDFFVGRYIEFAELYVHAVNRK